MKWNEICFMLYYNPFHFSSDSSNGVAKIRFGGTFSAYGRISIAFENQMKTYYGTYCPALPFIQCANKQILSLKSKEKSSLASTENPSLLMSQLLFDCGWVKKVSIRNSNRDLTEIWCCFCRHFHFCFYCMTFFRLLQIIGETLWNEHEKYGEGHTTHVNYPRWQQAISTVFDFFGIRWRISWNLIPLLFVKCNEYRWRKKKWHRRSTRILLDENSILMSMFNSNRIKGCCD